MKTKEEIVSSLKQFDVGNRFSHVSVFPKASVLIPLFVRKGELCTLMTQRSEQLRTSAGEVCFPGGKCDPGDTDEVATALREAQEEIGLPPDHVQVVCRLFPIISKSGLIVTPVIGFIDEAFRATPNPAEVSAVFTVALDFFTSTKDHHAADDATETAGQLHFFYFEDPDTGRCYHILGLTAMFAITVAALALRKKPEFEIDFDIKKPLSFFEQLLIRRMNKL
ncbi:peroxisomal coenzyme A diphosphatase NUDT7 isoform X2 [Thalassophryne amazonica]|uniref:peroxisomal coenzyme A diphosphatase NUDT7 isoform X2 n=1 Tax=Thalassophryne amazonica TaxID=390379 RepID=UPI0014723805|nr:peroxisomal coenzyme A diphosphatase NUDT7 isoform X2 [Thalassophryne amazonica]